MFDPYTLDASDMNAIRSARTVASVMHALNSKLSDQRIIAAYPSSKEVRDARLPSARPIIKLVRKMVLPEGKPIEILHDINDAYRLGLKYGVIPEGTKII